MKTMRYFLRALQAAGVILAWSTMAMADGKITPPEMANLTTQLARLFDLDIDIVIPAELYEVELQVTGTPVDVTAMTAMLAQPAGMGDITPASASRHG